MPMVPIHSAADEMRAEFLVQLLASHDIEAQVTGAAMATLRGYVPATYGLLQVWVDEQDLERARPIVEQFERSRTAPPKAVAGEDDFWTCRGCGETIEPQFTDCWNCQTSRQTPADAAAPDGQAAPREPDPYLAVDLSCVRCEYNLRGLPVDRDCPECAHPALASLLEHMRCDQEWSLENEPALGPCLDYIEQSSGFPLEAIAFVALKWPRAQELALDKATDRPVDEADVAAALRDLAADFLGDAVIAARAMQRWRLTSPTDLKRLLRYLTEHRLVDG